MRSRMRRGRLAATVKSAGWGEVDMRRIWEWLKQEAAPIGLVLTVVGLVGGAGYTAGLKLGENNAKEVEDFRKTLPPMMQDLHKLADELAKDVAMRNENSQLKAAKVDYEAKIIELENKNKESSASLKKDEDELSQLRDQVAKLFPATSVAVTIMEHNAPEIIKGLLRIGLDSVYPSNSFVSVHITGTGKGYSGSMDLNDPKELAVVGGSCVVTVTKINYPSADFVALCGVKAKD
jgi:hypothetical protein